MSSEEASLIATNSFIRNFVFGIVQNIRAKNFNYDEPEVIHSDLVPRVSEKVMQASMEKKFIPSMEILAAPVQRPRQMPPPRRVIARPRPPMPPPRRAPMPPPMPVQPVAQIPQAPQIPQGTGLSQEYGKITPLLHDPSVSTIECAGIGKPITVIRTGQKQVTRIVLSAEEIKEILTKVSDSVHIPLLEGVFRAAVDNFSVNAVISEMIGSRFVIKKQTAYALLER